MSRKESKRDAAVPLVNSARPNSNELGPEASENTPLPWNPHLRRTTEKMTCLYKVYGGCAMQDKV